jgi:hypothetical protein
VRCGGEGVRETTAALPRFPSPSFRLVSSRPRPVGGPPTTCRPMATVTARESFRIPATPALLSACGTCPMPIDRAPPSIHPSGPRGVVSCRASLPYPPHSHLPPLPRRAGPAAPTPARNRVKSRARGTQPHATHGMVMVSDQMDRGRQPEPEPEPIFPCPKSNPPAAFTPSAALPHHIRPSTMGCVFISPPLSHRSPVSPLPRRANHTRLPIPPLPACLPLTRTLQPPPSTGGDRSTRPGRRLSFSFSSASACVALRVEWPPAR